MAFTGNDPKDTYLGILTMGDDGGGPPVSNVLHAVNLQPVLDAAGSPSLLELSQSKVAFTGIMEASVASGIIMDTGIPIESDSLVTDSLLSQSDNAVGILFTSGDPEGSLAASVGSVALRLDGTAGATAYIKQSGVGNTGWAAVDTVATFLDLTDTPAVYSAEKWVRVNAGGTALELVDPPTVALGNFNELADVPPAYGGFGGYVVAVNLAETGLTFTNAAVGAFTDLSDTPAALIANKYLQVNAGGTAIEFVDSTTGEAFVGMSDTPADYTDAEGAILAVNAAGNAVEFIGDLATWGDILFFDGANWVALAAGTEGQVLTTHEATGDPTWEDAAAGAADFLDLTDTPAAYTDMEGAIVAVNAAGNALEFIADSAAQGEVLYFDGTNWVALAVSTAGYVLTTQGAAANPTWEAVTVSGVDFVDLDDTPAGYGTDGQVIVTNGVDTLSWADPPGPTEVPQFNVIDQEWEVICFGGLNLSLTLSAESIVDFVICTGDGSTSAFTDADGSPLGVNIEPGSVQIDVVLTSGTATITDDGEGILADGVANVTGTIDYGFGTWSLTFSGNVPANLADFQADYTQYTGTTPQARITAYDCIRSIHGGYPPFQYGIELSGGGMSFTPQTNSRDSYVALTCAEIGVPTVDVYVRDTYGTYLGPITVSLLLTDPGTICP